VFLVCTLSLGVAGPPDQKKSPKAAPPPEPGKKTQPKPKDALGRLVVEIDKVQAIIDKMIAEYDLKPKPLPAIPDDPPPHEGAMISMRHLIEPPDLVIVEVLDALPGRPISGERLVRPDGKISLGFYGDVDARGLTLDQLKVAIIKHLRGLLTDEALGVREPLFESEPQATGDPQARPDVPQQEQNPAVPGNKGKTRPTAFRSTTVPRATGQRLPLGRRAAQPIPIRLVQSRFTGMTLPDQQPSPPERQEPPAKSPDGFQFFGRGQGRITITIEIDGQRQTVEKKLQPGQEPPAPEVVPPAAEEKKKPGQKPPDEAPLPPGGERQDYCAVIPPAASEAVFVDLTAYNSKNYYVLGDLMITGKMPWTGNETVLDALQHAGGLMPEAEPKDIRLLRPGRNGKPSRVYKVDLEAIREKGDVTSNYQIFPGDRLIVGRNEVVKRTVELDRVAAPLSTVTNAIQRLANSIRSLQEIDPADADLIMKHLTDFWVKELSRKGDLQFDEATLREALLQRLKERAAPKNKPK